MTAEERIAFGAKMKAAREAKKVAENIDLAEDIVPEAPLLETPIITNPKIVLNFIKNIEVYINGKAYVGASIEVDNMKTGAEIVRIAKEAYGYDILK